jgi:hypothetical protein
MRLFTPYGSWRLLNATLFSLAFWLPWTTNPPTNGLSMVGLIGMIIFLNPFGMGVFFGCVYSWMNMILAFRQVTVIQRRDLQIALWGWGLGSVGVLFWIEAQLRVGIWLMLFTLLSSYVLEYYFIPHAAPLQQEQ